jgi:hypothetical protein
MRARRIQLHRLQLSATASDIRIQQATAIRNSCMQRQVLGYTNLCVVAAAGEVGTCLCVRLLQDQIILMVHNSLGAAAPFIGGSACISEL